MERAKGLNSSNKLTPPHLNKKPFDMAPKCIDILKERTRKRPLGCNQFGGEWTDSQIKIYEQKKKPILVGAAYFFMFDINAIMTNLKVNAIINVSFIDIGSPFRESGQIYTAHSLRVYYKLNCCLKQRQGGHHIIQCVPRHKLPFLQKRSTKYLSCLLCQLPLYAAQAKFER